MVFWSRGRLVRTPARFKFKKKYFLLCFKSEGWWLVNKKVTNNFYFSLGVLALFTSGNNAGNGNTASAGIRLTCLAPLPPARLGAGGKVSLGQLGAVCPTHPPGFTGPVAGGCRHRHVVCFAPFGVFVSRLAPLAVSLIPYSDRYVVTLAQCLKMLGRSRPYSCLGRFLYPWWLSHDSSPVICAHTR